MEATADDLPGFAFFVASTVGSERPLSTFASSRQDFMVFLLIVSWIRTCQHSRRAPANTRIFAAARSPRYGKSSLRTAGSSSLRIENREVRESCRRLMPFCF